MMSTSVGDGLPSSAERDLDEVHEQLNDPEEVTLNMRYVNTGAHG